MDIAQIFAQAHSAREGEKEEEEEDEEEVEEVEEEKDNKKVLFGAAQICQYAFPDETFGFAFHDDAARDKKGNLKSLYRNTCLDKGTYRRVDE